jgi:signal transduction histidine kinase
MPQGGTLTLGARTTEGGVVVSVGDTGPGIAPDIQKLLFQPLVTTRPSGLGLGLTTARNLIDNQDGSITYESRSGAGTRFDVRLPVAAASAG